MPMHPVTSTLMYRGICTIPDILSYSAPVNLPEDEVEGEMPPVLFCFFSFGVVLLWVFVQVFSVTAGSCRGRFCVPVVLSWLCSSFKQTRGQHPGQRS